MRILGISDTHLGKDGWYGYEVLSKAQELAESMPIDVIFHGGDLVEPNSDVRFEDGLELLAKLPAKHKVFVLGNKEIELLDNSKLTEHYDEMEGRLAAYDIALLDKNPHVVDDVAFAGNIGWCDGSLWVRSPIASTYLNTRQEIRQAERESFSSAASRLIPTETFSSHDFYVHSQDRIRDQLDQLEENPDVSAIVLGTHFVPSRDFIKYGENPKFDFLNWRMGAEGHSDNYQREKVVLGFTGHTHRSDAHTVGRLIVQNLSGKDQPRLYELQAGANGYSVHQLK